MRNLTLTVHFCDISQPFVSATKYENISNTNTVRSFKFIIKVGYDFYISLTFDLNCQSDASKFNTKYCHPGAICVLVLFWALCTLIGRAMSGLRLFRLLSQLSHKYVTPLQPKFGPLSLTCSFRSHLSFYKKDCGSLKASWTNRRRSSSRRPASRETGPNRLFPELLRRGRGIAPQIDTGPEDGFDSATAPGG
jgi:hypothetical protein